MQPSRPSKSTLLKIVAGILRADRGEILWRDAPLRVDSPHAALAAGIGMVYQERLFFPNLSVTANIFAGHEITDRAGCPAPGRVSHRQALLPQARRRRILRTEEGWLVADRSDG